MALALNHLGRKGVNDGMRSWNIEGELGVELLHVKRSNLNLFPHLIRVLPGHDPQYPGVDLELSGVIIHLISSWEHLGIPQEELEGVAEETDVRDTLLPLGPLQAKQNG